MIKQDRGIPFFVSASGTATAIATQSGVTSVIQYVTDISGSVIQSGGTIAVYGGSAGATVLWQDFIPGSGSLYAYTRTFSEPLTGVAGQAVKVQTFGSIICYANIAGFSLNAS